MRRDYALLLSATFVSFTGDWILTASLAYQVYALTGSTMASAAMVFAGLLPRVLLGSFAGVLADRWDRRRTMIGANLLLAVALIPLLLVDNPEETPIVYAVVTGQSAIAVFFAAAEAALLPQLVPERTRVTANALNGQIRDVARLTGAALGGVLAALGGIPLTTITDALTFIAAAGLLTMIRFRASRAQPATPPSHPHARTHPRPRHERPAPRNRHSRIRRHPGTRSHPRTRSHLHVPSHLRRRGHPHARSQARTRGRPPARSQLQPTSCRHRDGM